jgi:hypothetical protein
VYIDLSFYQVLAKQLGAPGEFAQPYVLAHEYGHHIQDITGIEADMRRAQQRDPDQANALSVKLELQADCYAGAWALEMKRQGRVDVGAFNQTLDLFEKTGGSGDAWLDPDSHGNKFQRIRSFTQGFEEDATGCTGAAFDAMLGRVGLDRET